jgi:hypothetical protein
MRLSLLSLNQHLFSISVPFIPNHDQLPILILPDNNLLVYTTSINISLRVQSIGYAQSFNELALSLYDLYNGLNVIYRLTTSCNYNSSETSSSNMSQCTCTAPSIWIKADCVTLTDAICQTLTNSNVNTTNPQAYSCNCNAPFNTTFATCVIDCTQASTNSNGTQFEYDLCYCTAANTAWNHTGNTCSFYIKCANTTTNSIGVNVSSSTCICNNGVIFDPTVLACVRNCILLNHPTTINTTDLTHYVCSSGFFYNNSFNNVTNPIGACQRNC